MQTVGHLVGQSLTKQFSICWNKNSIPFDDRDMTLQSANSSRRPANLHPSLLPSLLLRTTLTDARPIRPPVAATNLASREKRVK